ncbi:MAG: 1-acyl-sn-glycerol-3-phosphate acyltransferase, partial [Paludibacteraceae bacterium]|nr:1-acyl-sn-glycerol-3-phosphate acyltransferase [Paludibacteraceae bacterium]
MSISNFILKKLGWTHHVDIEIPPKAVICIAPHTSNYDFIFGQLFAKANNIKASFFIKDTWFFFPMNLFFKALGGIPVNRSKKTSMTSRIAEAIKKEDKALLAITPEGTRQANPEWKKGFYYIALEAGIPILLAH